MNGEYCYLSGTKSIKDGKVDFCIIVSFNKPDKALEYYSKRWQTSLPAGVETLFRALKTSGFNLEDTHVTHPVRLEKLILLLMIAFVWCYNIGDFIDEHIKAIKIEKHGRRAISGVDMDSIIYQDAYYHELINITLSYFNFCHVLKFVLAKTDLIASNLSFNNQVVFLT